MDFGLVYTEEQERFRKEVRAWFEKNIPERLKRPVDDRGDDYTPEMHDFWKQKHKELAKKGWLFPTYPKEYGGGGLTGDHEAIIQEEMERARAVGPITDRNTLNLLLVWATEEQKQKFLAPILKAEQTVHMRMTEPHSGADLADYRSRAVRDGDDWLLTGQNVFISAHGDEEWLPGPMLTDPNAPRHRNMGYFMVPNPAPGMEVRPMDLLVGHRQKEVFMDSVRIPGDHLIGGDHQGWQVHSTHLENEHGGGGRAFPRDEAMENLLDYVKETKHNGGTLGSDPVVQQTTMDAYLDAHVGGLFQKRTYWLYQSKQVVQFEGNMANVFGRHYSLRNAKRARDVMGLYSLLGTKEPLAPHGGAHEVEQRSRAGQNHAGGSTNIAKVILSRRIGISRTKERPAPTPATAGQLH